MSPAGDADAGIPTGASLDRRGAQASVSLGFGSGVRVQSPSSALLDGLLEYFADWQAPDADAECVVECVLDAGRCEALARQVAGDPGRQRGVFALDTEVLHMPCWQRGDATLVRDDFCGCWYVLEEGRITLVSHPGAARTWLGLLRVVRELVCARTAAADTLELHAAAVEIGGRALLLCGPKRAGKSSLLCHLLGSGHARLIANDRVQIRHDGAQLVARGIPTVVRLRPPGVTSVPRWAREADDAAAEPLLLSPAQLGARLGTGSRAQAPLGAILHLEIVAEGPGLALQEPSREAALSRLLACTYGVPHARPTLIDAMMRRPPPGRTPPDCTPAAVVAARVPQRLCRLGPAAYAEPVAPLVATLAELWQSR